MKVSSPMRALLLLACLLAAMLPSTGAASAQSQRCSADGTYPEGAVFTLEGTPHLWIFQVGALRWVGDTRALAGMELRWDRQCTMNTGLLQRVQVGDPLLSLGLVKIGDPIYLAKWETTDALPRLLQIQSLADVAVFGINGDNYGRFVLDRGPWEQRYGFNADVLARGALPAVVQPDQQVATRTQSGWATVTDVPDSFVLAVRNARGEEFAVWHIGIVGPSPRQGDWRGRGIAQQRSLLPPGTRVWLEKEAGISDPAPDLLLRDVSSGPGQAPVAERLLRAGTVWVFPHGKHAHMLDYADAQAAAVSAKAGAWAETKTSGVFKPRGTTRGGFPIDPAVASVLAALDQERLGNAVLQAVNTFPVEIGVSAQSQGTLASFSPRFYSIQLSPEIMTADPTAVAGVLIHELTHARNMIDRLVDSATIGCYEDENNAFEATALYWADLYPNGKRPTTHWLDDQLNENLAQYRAGQIDARVRQDYGHECGGG